jgi:hypothetical protein
LNASEIIYLREQGVSDRVLATMLNQQPQFANAPQPAAPATSAPQYAAPPATTAVVETAPVSTPYVIPSTPTYYSFYDPSPYWYEPWPYWYTSPYWYGYPLFTFGFYWGNCGYGYWNHGYCYNGHWNNYWHDGNHHGDPHNGNRANGNSPQHDGKSVPGGKTGMLASKGNPVGGVNQPGSGPGPSARSATGATQASLTTQSKVVSRSGAGQANASSSAVARAVRRTCGGGANSRPPLATRLQAAGRPVTCSQPAPPRTAANQASATPSRSGPVAGPTTVRTGNSGQGPVSRSVVSQRAPSFPGPTRASVSPTWNKSASQPVSRPAVSPAASYPRSSFSPSYSSRGGGSVASIGRPSMPSSYGGMGSPSAYRGGGGFSGGSAPRMSSGGFGSGGGGGFRWRRAAARHR